jgi:hypothetical protein
MDTNTPYQATTLLLISSVGLANLHRQGTLQKTWGSLTTGLTHGGASSTMARSDWQAWGQVLLATAILTFAAGLNPAIGKGTIALGFGLWLIFLMTAAGTGSTNL